MASPPSSSNPEPAASANPLLALSGTVLEARYELGRVLGAGGMGAVFEATQLRLGRKVAIKVMRPGLAEHEDYIKRFRREARIASEIRHRNVVEVHDFGEAANGLVYCVMELLKGQDLEHLLARQPRNRLPWDRALGLVLQVASGLRAAHAAGIIHRDIKPANCFLVEDDDGEPLVKVLDFGIAKLGDGEDVERISSTSEVLGTPCYMAPELVVSKTPASPRTDIYSLGVLAYRMLAGSVPFTGATSFQVLHRACYERVPSLRSHGVEVPRGVEALVMRMLAKTAKERPADVQEVRGAIAGLLRGGSVARAVEIPASAALVIGMQPRGAEGEMSDSEVAPTLPSAGSGAAAAGGELPKADDARGEPVTPKPAPAARSVGPRRPRKRAERVQLELSALGELDEPEGPSMPRERGASEPAPEAPVAVNDEVSSVAPAAVNDEPPAKTSAEVNDEPSAEASAAVNDELPAVASAVNEESSAEASAAVNDELPAVASAVNEESSAEASAAVNDEPPSSPPAVAPAPQPVPLGDHADGLLPNGAPVPVLRPVERRPAVAAFALSEAKSKSRVGVVVGVIGVVVALAAGAYFVWHALLASNTASEATQAESKEP